VDHPDESKKERHVHTKKSIKLVACYVWRNSKIYGHNCNNFVQYVITHSSKHDCSKITRQSIRVILWISMTPQKIGLTAN